MNKTLRIAVVSDTHHHTETVIKDLLAHPCDELIFLGDLARDGAAIAEACSLPAVILNGNCDGLSFADTEIEIERAGYRLFCTHGHRYQVKQSLFALQYRAQECKADIVLYGHTHTRRNDVIGGIRFINPGSTGMPNYGEKPSYVCLKLSPEGVMVSFRFL